MDRIIALLVWLPREAIQQNLTNLFRKAGYYNCRVILDCTEVFNERSESLDNQTYTWSDYKHHNIIKILLKSKWFYYIFIGLLSWEGFRQIHN